MSSRGVWVVLLMAALGVLASGTSVWYHFGAGHRAAEFWGPHAARLLGSGPHVELVQIEPAATEIPGPDSVAIDSRPYRIVRRRDISAAPGISHARRALALDATLAATGESAAGTDWGWLLIFRGADDQRAEVLFEPGCRRMALAAAPDRRQELVERSAAALAAFFAEQFPPPGPLRY